MKKFFFCDLCVFLWLTLYGDWEAGPPVYPTDQHLQHTHESYEILFLLRRELQLQNEIEKFHRVFQRQ